MNVFKGMTHNVAGHLDPEKRRASGQAAINECLGGIGVLNEINPEDVQFYKNYLKVMGFQWYRRGQNAIVWDPRVLEMHACGFRVIMIGGRRGPGGRRLGPNRTAIKWKGELRKDGTRLQVVGIHKIAKAFTSHAWRQPWWFRSTRATSRYVNRSIKNYPNGFIAGDENSKKLVDYPNLDDHAVATPPSHGRSRYDQVHVFGKLNVMNVHEHHTPSDHDLIAWDNVIKGAF